MRFGGRLRDKTDCAFVLRVETLDSFHAFLVGVVDWLTRETLLRVSARHVSKGRHKGREHLLNDIERIAVAVDGRKLLAVFQLDNIGVFVEHHTPRTICWRVNFNLWLLAGRLSFLLRGLVSDLCGLLVSDQFICRALIQEQAKAVVGDTLHECALKRRVDLHRVRRLHGLVGVVRDRIGFRDCVVANLHRDLHISEPLFVHRVWDALESMLAKLKPVLLKGGVWETPLDLCPSVRPLQIIETVFLFDLI